MKSDTAVTCVLCACLANVVSAVLSPTESVTKPDLFVGGEEQPTPSSLLDARGSRRRKSAGADSEHPMVEIVSAAMAAHPESDIGLMVFMVFYIVPALASALACISPICLLACLEGSIGGAWLAFADIMWVHPKRLSQVSILILLSSPIFFWSDFIQNKVFLYATYCVILALANLLAERLARKRVWPVLCLWQAMNLLNLVGGKFGVFQIYYVTSAGLTQSAFFGLGLGCNALPLPPFPSWCGPSWIMIQVFGSFVYIVMHLGTFFLAISKVVKHYGGEAEQRDDTTHTAKDAS